jgi:hypothetical protein
VLAERREHLGRWALAAGRIASDATSQPFLGAAVLVGDGLRMTNRHVARAFLGDLFGNLRRRSSPTTDSCSGGNGAGAPVDLRAMHIELSGRAIAGASAITAMLVLFGAMTVRAVRTWRSLGAEDRVALRRWLESGTWAWSATGWQVTTAMSRGASPAEAFALEVALEREARSSALAEHRWEAPFDALEVISVISFAAVPILATAAGIHLVARGTTAAGVGIASFGVLSWASVVVAVARRWRATRALSRFAARLEQGQLWRWRAARRIELEWLSAHGWGMAPS